MTTIRVYGKGGFVEIPESRLITVDPLTQKPTESIQARTERHLIAFPCIHRGDQIRIEKKRGSCACSSSPVVACSAPDNADGESSLWKFAQGQQMPTCSGCAWRR